MVNIGNDWDKLLADEFRKDYFLSLCEFLESEYRSKTVYPAREDIFKAMQVTSYKQTKVVIVGQDPYPIPKQANGLAFSVPIGVEIPYSWQLIFQEIHDDVNCPIPNNGFLLPWANQGVLLLNAVLTINPVLTVKNNRSHVSNSHVKHGWETFTRRVLEELNRKDPPVVFLLWGKEAQALAKSAGLDTKQHNVLTAAHPSPMSNIRAKERFLGCKHFSKTNDLLGKEAIDWRIPNVK